MKWPEKFPLPSTLVLVALVAFMAQSTLLGHAEVVSRAEASRVVPDQNAETTGPVIKPIELAAFETTLERPLFSPERRPYAPEPVMTPVVSSPEPEPETIIPDAGGIILSGAMTLNGVVSVLLEGFSESRWVSEGDTFEGWSVVKVENGGVVLQMDDTIARKGIFDN